jgi:hypothetical protein
VPYHESAQAGETREEGGGDGQSVVYASSRHRQVHAPSVAGVCNRVCDGAVRARGEGAGETGNKGAHVGSDFLKRKTECALEVRFPSLVRRREVDVESASVDQEARSVAVSKTCTR